MHHPAMSPPLLTHDLPGTGGRINVAPEDFEDTIHLTGANENGPVV